MKTGKLMKKLNNSKAFTLSELLAVVLILSLIMTTLAGGLTVVRAAYEKITLKASDNIRIDPLDAMLDGFIANYIDNARDVVNGDAALSAWEEMFGGEKKDGKSNGSQGAAKDSV